MTEPGDRPASEPGSADRDVEAPTAPAPSYELPSARTVVASGLQLAIAATGDIRRAGLYVGALLLALLGPVVLTVLPLAGRFGSAVATITPAGDLDLGAEAGIVLLVGSISLAGIMALSVDASLIAVALLGGRAAGTPLPLAASIRRARQTFWPMVGGGLIVGIVQGVANSVLLGALGGGADMAVPASVLATLLTAPFGYLAAAIVLGGVGPLEGLSRSVRLARVRPWLAATVAVFALVTSLLQLFGISSGLDLGVRVGEALHLGAASGFGGLVLGGAAVIVGSLALGSLLFTVAAIVAAPQVTAFLGLTHYSGGLDAVRAGGAGGAGGVGDRAPVVRWVSWPMAAGIAVELGCAILVLAGAV